MSEEWLTYSDLSQRLGISPEAARQKAIRGHWPRRTANDGKTQVRVDVEDVRASTTVRKPKEEPPSNERPTADEQASDTGTLDALKDHIVSLKAMAAKAEEIAGFERDRANSERARADQEHDRAETLTHRLADVEAAHASLEDQAAVLRDVLANREIEIGNERDRVADLSARLLDATVQVAEGAGIRDDLKGRLEAVSTELQALRSRPWWRRVVG